MKIESGKKEEQLLDVLTRILYTGNELHKQIVTSDGSYDEMYVQDLLELDLLYLIENGFKALGQEMDEDWILKRFEEIDAEL